MKKVLLLAMLAMTVVAGSANAQGRGIRTLAPLKWVKGVDANGIAVTDSSYINMLFVAATNGSDPDTTVAVDVWGPNVVANMPNRFAANDSMVVVSAYLHWGAPYAGSGLPANNEASTDTMRVQIQYSGDGTSWVSQKFVTVVGGASNDVDAYRLTNQVAAMDRSRYIRFIVTNFDKSTDAGTTGHSFWIVPQVIYQK